MRVGDMVQAVEAISEENFNGFTLWTHAASGDLGRVLDVLADGSINVHFERTGTITVCLPEEVRFLGDAETGRAPINVPPLLWS